MAGDELNMDLVLIKNTDFFMPDISVVVPVYNKEEYVEEPVRSALSQPFQAIEVLVVNDGSTDGSGKICEMLAQEDARVRYWSQPNQGVVAARNHAIRHSRGRFIFPLDADDVMSAECLEKMYEAMLREKADVVYSYFSRDVDCRHVVKSLPVTIPEILVKNSVPVSALYRRESWVQYGGYRDDMSGGLEDWDFWLNFVEDGRRFFLIEAPLLFWRPVEGSRNKMNKDTKVDMIKKIISNHPELYRKYRSGVARYIAFRLVSFFRFIPACSRLRESLKIYSHVRKYG